MIAGPGLQAALAEVGRIDAEGTQGVPVVPGDDGGGDGVDGLKLRTPEPAAKRSKGGHTLAEEVALKGEVLHLIPQEFVGDFFHHGVGAAEVKRAEIDLGDQFRREQHLDGELEIHEETQAAENGVRPLLREQFAAEMLHSAGEQAGVALLLGDEEIDGALVAAEVLQRGDLAGIPSEARACAGFTELKGGDGGSERHAQMLRQRAGFGGEFEFVVEARVALEVGDPGLGVHVLFLVRCS